MTNFEREAYNKRTTQYGKKSYSFLYIHRNFPLIFVTQSNLIHIYITLNNYIKNYLIL